MKKWLLLILLQSPFTAYAYGVEVWATAYTPYENSNITATGEVPKEGIIAADFLPLGTRVVIDDKEYIVGDRMGGGYTDRIDIFMDSYERAIEYGRRKVMMEVLE